MSPGISLSVRVPNGHSRTPRLMALAAIHEARHAGIPLRFGDLGVVRGPGAAPWIIDRGGDVRGVNLAGLLLVLLRPTPDDDLEDFTAAAGRAIGVGLAWISGAVDGWNRESHDAVALKADREKYLLGYETGLECRLLATLVCDHCGSRRFRSEAVCPGCDRREG